VVVVSTAVSVCDCELHEVSRAEMIITVMDKVLNFFICGASLC
jgi:hypothetical protein